MAEKITHKKYEGMIPEEALEHMRAARHEIYKSVEGIIPPEFIEHRRKVRKELLLAWRSMIDASLKRMEEHEKNA